MATSEISPSYRLGKPLSFELIQHVGIFLEERLYTQAFTLLFNIISSGSTSWNQAHLPSPPYFAVAATCLVHPRTTTRAKSPEEKDAAPAALRLLRLARILFGPINASFGIAFTFNHFGSSRRGLLRRRASDDDGVSEGGISYFDDMKPLNLDLGRSSSLWSRAEDFWQAAGWTFNCSVLHPERWAPWCLWLEFMCDVLEDDWAERLKMHKGDDGDHLRQSLIFHYVDRGSTGFANKRRMLRAIFADGSPASVSEFGQIFAKELEFHTANDDKNTDRTKGPAVNVDAEQFGDYLSYDEDNEMDYEDNGLDNKPVRKRPRRGTRAGNTVSAPEDPVSPNLNVDISRLGSMASLNLRQRLLSLLSGVSSYLPDSFLPLDDLYHLFVENIRHLSVPIFQSFVSPSSLSAFSQDQQATLYDHLLSRMLEPSAPNSQDYGLTQTKLEQCFLPFAASTASVADNAKVSITLEAMLILLGNGNLVTVTPALRDAAKRGIIARMEKTGPSESKKKGPRPLDIERCWLLESGDRLMFLLDEVLAKCPSK